jgi:hypothetical protein
MIDLLILCGTMLAVVCALAMVYISRKSYLHTPQRPCTGDCNQGRNCTCVELEKD